MMLTMARTSDSFLPSGVMLDPTEQALSFAGLAHGHSNHSNSSGISPLALPRASNQLSYFDHSSLARGGGPPQHRYVPSNTREQRSASLSPTNNQTAAQLRRVTLQNRRLLENWEAERAHLEANRARAEEIYKEERAIMDDERSGWGEKEKAYETRIGDLEQENAELRRRLNLASRQRGSGNFDGASNSTEQIPGAQSTVNESTSTARVQSPSGGPTVAGQTAALSNPFEQVLDPRIQGASPNSGSPGIGSTPNQERVPSIDIQEINPNLEGIPLRLPTIQRPTFQWDQRSASPPVESDSSTPVGSNQESPDGRSRASPAELTREALEAPEYKRLTLHAGNTPNINLSRLSTVLSTNAVNTADSSGASTPTHTQLDNGQDKVGLAGDELALLEPTDEPLPLSGDLGLRNRPVTDEPFLQKLNDILLESLETDNATPKVLKTDSEWAQSGLSRPQQSEASQSEIDGLRTEVSLPGGADGANDVSDESNPKDDDIPIRFKDSNNFGAPFGKPGKSGKPEP